MSPLVPIARRARRVLWWTRKRLGTAVLRIDASSPFPMVDAQRKRDAIAFRYLGEEAEAAGDLEAAEAHYVRAIERWRFVGCRKRLADLRADRQRPDRMTNRLS
jgi:hypothetical protein